jgi:hypothetical protein
VLEVTRILVAVCAIHEMMHPYWSDTPQQNVIHVSMVALVSTPGGTVPTDRQLGHNFAIFGACFRHNMNVVPPSGLPYVSSSEYERSMVRDNDSFAEIPHDVFVI